MHEINICWFKKDLRVVDNEALYEASRDYDILPIYILEKEKWQQLSHSYRQWQFCKECLIDLKEDLYLMGQPLIIRIGDVIDIFEEIKKTYEIKGIYSHQETGDFLSYKRDQKVRRWSKENNIPWEEYIQFGVFRGPLKRDKWAKTYKKHFEKEIINITKVFKALPFKGESLPSDNFFNFENDKCHGRCIGGRKEAIKRLNIFLNNEIYSYGKNISSPAKSYFSCSRLSPYITMGCISLKEVLKHTKLLKTKDSKMFTSRLFWHCHFIQKLETQPELEFKEYHPYFENIRIKNDYFLEAWSEGKTGYPFLDACMRSLNHNGWINFRMRAMLMSFASYNLWIPWQESGLKLAQKFIDYEPGIHWNQCQMQSGTTSINTNRIYNPIKQGKDHDPKGTFIKKWVPELKDISEDLIHEPWLINNIDIYDSQTVNYVKPIIDLKLTSRRARKLLFQISLKKGYWDISKTIYEKHGSRKPSNKRKAQKIMNKNSSNKQFELDLKL